MKEEEAHLHQAIKATKSMDAELSKYMSLIYEYQLNANRHLCSKLLLLEKRGGTSMPHLASRNGGGSSSTGTAQAQASHCTFNFS